MTYGMTPCSSAGAVSRADLFARPPFAVKTGTPVSTRADTLEFTGLFGTGDDIEISLREPGGRATWVRLRDPAARHYVESLNEAGDEITLIAAGLRVCVALRRESREGRASTTWTMPDLEGHPVTVSAAAAPVTGTYAVDADTGTPFVHRNTDGTVWSEPLPGQGLHPNDPGNRD